MTKFLSRSVLILLAVELVGCARHPEEFKSQAGGFSVMTPVALKEGEQMLNAPAGNVEMHTFTAKAGNVAYIVVHGDYPGQFGRNTDSARILDRARDAATSSRSGKLTSESQISLDGHPGRELTFDTNGPNGEAWTIRLRKLLVGSRIYQTLIVGDTGDVPNSSTDAFLQSFKLLSK